MIKPKLFFDCKSDFIFERRVRHFWGPLEEALENFPDNYRSCLERGERVGAAYIIMQYFVNSCYSSKDLPQVFAEAETYWDDLDHTGQLNLMNVTAIYRQTAFNLAGRAEDPLRLVGEAFNEDLVLTDRSKAVDRTLVFGIYYNLAFLNYLFGKFQTAQIHLEKAEAYYDGMIGTFSIPQLYFIGALNRLTNLGGSRRQDRIFWRRIDGNIRRMQILARYTPERVAAKLKILLAERARLQGIILQADDLYEQAIATAHLTGSLFEEALSNELAGKFYFGRGKPKIAAVYLKEAALLYHTWGASQKVLDLEDEIPEVFTSTRITRLQQNEPPAEISTYRPSRIDLLKIVEASQAISEEIVQEELLKKLLRVIFQNSVAERVVFLINDFGRLYIQAEGDIHSEPVRVMQALPLEQCPNLPRKLLADAARLKECISWQNGKEDSTNPDPYLEGSQLTSVICLPVIAKLSLFGLVYLENDIFGGLLNEEYHEMLKIFSAQLAISMENARLYEHMEQMVTARTEEVKKRNRELLLTNKQLEQSSAIKNQFVANVSHEIRTPLHGITGMVNLLQKTDLKPMQQEYVNLIGVSVKSLQEIVNDILDMAKIEANRMQLDMKVFEIRDLVQEVIQFFLYNADDKGISLTHSVALRIPSLLNGDPLRLRQIMVNLLSNAIKFTEKGKVDLSLTVEKVEGDELEIAIIVQDTGIGIPRDKIPVIFELFTQADAGISRKFEGTGLGLAITKRLVELMQGSIEVESEVGRGSRFRCIVKVKKVAAGFVLPVADEVDYITGDETGNLSGLRVLVAEDNPVNRKYLVSLLHLLQCEVRVASNGLGAIQLVKDNEFDCILMDKNMPELDGVEAIRLIRAHERGSDRHIPIVAITAAAIGGDRNMLLEAGSDYYLSKPVREKELVGILQRIRSHRIFPDEKFSPPEAETAPAVEHSPAVNTGIIDIRTFLEEARLFSETTMLEVLDEVTINCKFQLETLLSCRERQNRPGLRMAAHKLAGSLGTARAMGLIDLCRRLEREAETGSWETLEEISRELEKEMPRFYQEVDQLQKALRELSPG